MDIVIRRYKDKDAKGVAEVGSKSWIKTYTHIFGEEFVNERISRSYVEDFIKRSAKASEKTQMFVAEMDGNIIGFTQPGYYNYWDKVTYDPNRMLLTRIYLDPEVIGKGIGSNLLIVSEKWIKQKGFSEYYVYVHKDNDIGWNFYKARGFTVEKEANEDDEVFLKKLIE